MSATERVRRGLSEAVKVTDAALVLLLSLVALVGALTAFSVRLFETGIDASLDLGFRRFPEYLSRQGLPQWSAFLLYPVILGLAVAGVKALVRRPDRHHSVPLVMISMSKRGGRIYPLSTLMKTISAVLTLGAGGSLGREGPVVLLGGGLGSAVGQAVGVRREDWLNILIAAGSGAAIATVFHAPITGALFAMEIVLIQFSARSFALVGLACVVATQVSGLLEGAPPFPIPAYEMHSSWEIPLYILLGLAIALVARAYVKVLYGSEHWGQRLKWLPSWLKPALGGLLFGAVAIVLPRTLGGGYDTISLALAGQLSLGLLLLFLIGKFLTIGLTSGGGWPGGVFTPALFLGSMAGGIFGILAAGLFPSIIQQPGMYAVIGMAAMIAGATHAPLTAMTLVFEVTRDYRIAIPAMLACGVATVFSQRLSPYSIDTLHLGEHGILLPWQIRDLRSIQVGDVMTQQPDTVRADMQLGKVIVTMQANRHAGYPVLDEAGRLCGIITLSDVRDVPLEHRLSSLVKDVMSTSLAVLTPDQTLADAALIMARRGIGRLPVVDAQNRNRLVGIITRSSVLQAYPAMAENPSELPAFHEAETFLER